jgi:hypothetical protein
MIPYRSKQLLLSFIWLLGLMRFVSVYLIIFLENPIFNLISLALEKLLELLFSYSFSRQLSS